MGPTKILLFWAMIMAPFGLLIGGLIMFLGLPLVYRIRGIPPQRRKITLVPKIVLTVIIAVLFSGAMCCSVVFDMLRYRNDYSKCQGSWNSWRIPLQEPYEIRMVDSMLHGSIAVWNHPETVLDNVVDFAHSGQYVAGATGVRIAKGKRTIDGWFLFDCTSGTVTKFQSQQDFLVACSAAGVRLPLDMHSVRETWYTYWKIIQQ